MSFTKFYAFIFLLLALQNINETDCGSLTAGHGITRREITNENGTDEFTFLVTGGYRPTDKSLSKYSVSIRTNVESLFFGDNHFCGGVIITKRAILTAAHCVFIKEEKKLLMAGQLVVVIGTPKRLQQVDTTQQIGGAKLIPHPEYGPDSFHADIAIIVLKKAIKIDGSSADIISLADSAPLENTKCTILGWGQIIQHGPMPDEEVFGDVIIQPTSVCQQTESFGIGMLCANDPNEHEVDSCQGDSGGPLICNGKSVGIVSYGAGCGLKSSVGVYTDVYHYRDWILKNSGGAKGLYWWLYSVCAMFLISK